jgi:hypothetical protein
MPRSAANFFGLVLVVFSIGFNTWRYPVVWRMASEPTASAASGESSQPSAPTLSAQPAKPAMAETERTAIPPILATQSETQPASNTMGKPVAAFPPLESNRPIVASLATIEHRLPESTSQEKPLAPVPKAIAAARPMGTAAEAVVRRLPPVDPNVPPPTGLTASASPGDAIPIYPSTGK